MANAENLDIASRESKKKITACNTKLVYFAECKSILTLNKIIAEIVKSL
jgi:hypothetical protein